MKITQLELRNIRCFVDASLSLSDGINVVIGKNNNGKSTLLNAISLFQRSMREHRAGYVRHGCDNGVVKAWVRKPDPSICESHYNCLGITTRDSNEIQVLWGDDVVGRLQGLTDEEPGNFLIPYQSRRKVASYSEGIAIAELNRVSGTLSNLNAKVDRVANPEYQPAHDESAELCDEIFGFRVTAVSSLNGKKAAYVIRQDECIPVEAMGEGVSSLLGLIVDLCRVSGKLFIIEEPENDIHPKALKRLLDLIVDKAHDNQFIVTTHSNLVLRHLGSSQGAKVFNVEMELENRIPTSTIRIVETPEERLAALEDLGYEPFDYELWNYWIFFEEASAERICRDFLIPYFVPGICGKVRPYSARSVSETRLKFDDFNRLFVFLHLEPIYKDKVWVVVDGGQKEKEILDKMKETYLDRGWSSDRFRQLSKHDFEEYYPERFADQVNEALREKDKQKRRDLKMALLNNVVSFWQEDSDAAKAEFQVSAAEVIEILRSVGKSGPSDPCASCE